MIDTHCHLVPGVDDGPSDQCEAVELARALTADGVTGVICTPHYARMFPFRHETAAKRLDALSDALRAAGLPLDLTLAGEIHPTFAISAPLEELRLRSIADQFAVVEVLPDCPTSFFASVAARLAEAGLVPIFAHPERCKAVQREIGLVDEVREHGAVIQVVAPSLIGRWGADVAGAAWRLVETGRADLVASDAHGVRRRRVHLRHAATLIERSLGFDVVDLLLERNPRKVLSGAFESTQGGAP